MRNAEKTKTQLSEELSGFRRLIENTGSVIFNLRIYPELYFDYLSPTISNFVRLDSKELIASPRRIFEVIHPDDRPILASLIESPAPSGRPISLRFLAKDGSVGWIELEYDMVFKDGRSVSVNGVARNITDRKIVEEALRASEQRYRSLIDDLPVGVAVVTPEGRPVQRNERLLEIYHLGSKDAAATPVRDNYFYPDDRQRFLALLDKGPVNDFEVLQSRADGSSFWATLSSRYQVTPSGEKQIITVFQDISGRKRAEEEINLKVALLEAASDTIFLRDFDAGPDAKFIYVNEAAARTLGYDREQFQKMSMRDLSLTAAGRVENNRKALIETGKNHSELFLRCEDGTKLPVENQASLATISAKRYILNVMRDITERKKAEAALKASEEKYRTMIETANEGVWLFDSDGRITFVNSRMAEMLGYLAEELIGKAGADFTYDEKEKARALARREARKRGNALKSYEREYRRKDGTPLWTLGSSAPLFNEKGEHVANLAMHTDITERKQAEEALLASEEKFRTLVENLPVGIAISNPEGQAFERNRALQEMYGYTSAEELMERPVAEFYADPDDREHFLKLLEKGPVRNFEAKRKRRDGSVFWTSITGVLHTTESGEKQIISTICDITEQKKAEEEIRLKATLLDAATDGILLRDFDEGPLAKFLYANDAASRISGFTTDELMSTAMQYLSLWTPPETVRTRRKQLAETGRTISESIWKRKDGTGVPIENHSRIINTGGRRYILSVIRDVSERKKSEEALKASEEKFRNLLENAPVGLTVSNGDGRRLEANKAAVEMHGYASKEDFLAVPVPDTYQNLEDRKYLLSLVEKGPFQNHEMQRKRKDGSVFWATLTSIPYTSSAGEKQLINVIEDITLRKQAEEALKASRQELRNFSAHLETAREEERAGVAREIHDELGQVLTALRMDMVWLKGRLPSSQKTAVAKLDTMVGLIDMASKRVREVSSRLRPGLLDDFGLSAALEWSVKEFRERTGIVCDLQFEPEDIALERDLATSLFRIFQEALTNIARHARATRASISLKQEERQITAVIRDNGKGIIPSEFLNPASLGIIGMRERVIYWGGRIDFDGQPGKGTTITIMIPLKKE